MYLPRIHGGQIEEEFHVSQVVAILGLSTFVLGLAFGPCTSFISGMRLTIVFLGPMSEFYGRKPVYIVSYLFFLSNPLGECN